MKAILSILFLITLSVPEISAQKSKGIGIGVVIYEHSYDIADSPHLPIIYRDKKLLEKVTGPAMPFIYKPDYGLYHFYCLERTAQYYKILINGETTAYVKNDSNFTFRTWKEMMIGISVSRLSPSDNPIRDTSDDKGNIIINPCQYDALYIVGMYEQQGKYWAKVLYHLDPGNCDTVFNPADTKVRNGYIQWRTRDKLLVSLILLD